MASSKKAGIMAMAGLQRSAATLRRFLPAAIWRPLGALANGIITPIRFSLATGHWKSSIAMSARAADGTPLPWYTYPAIDFLAQRDFSNCNVLEFGGGQSTLWWSARARSVLTIEEDAAWFARLQSQVGANVSLHHIPVDRVTRTIQPVIDLIAANRVGPGLGFETDDNELLLVDRAGSVRLPRAPKSALARALIHEIAVRYHAKSRAEDPRQAHRQ